MSRERIYFEGERAFRYKDKLPVSAQSIGDPCFVYVDSRCISQARTAETLAIEDLQNRGSFVSSSAHQFASSRLEVNAFCLGKEQIRTEYYIVFPASFHHINNKELQT